MGFLPTNGTSPRSVSAFLGSIHQHFGISRALCRVRPPPQPRFLSFFPSSDEKLRFGAETGNVHPFSGQVPSVLGALLPDLHPEELGKSGRSSGFPRAAISPPQKNPKGLLCRGKRVGGWSRGGHSQNLSPTTSSFVVGPIFPFQDGFYHKHLSSLGFRDAIRVTEEDTR